MSYGYERDATIDAREELQGELFAKNAFVVCMVGAVLFISALIITVM
jgi:hypothetical protein